MSETPAITSKNLPPQVPVVDTPLSDDQIVAKPLRAPNFINIKAKNPNFVTYWGNRSVGDKESSMRFDQLLSMGFAPAKPEQVCFIAENGQKQAVPNSLQRDGRIMYGDLILLIIARTDYVGALKWNAENAARRVRKFGSTQETPGGTDVNAEGSRGTTGTALGDITRSRAAQAGKIAAYIPPLAEVDSKTADNSGLPANLAAK
jgi:hypothetical protein